MSLEVTIAKRFEGFTLHADFTAGNTAAGSAHPAAARA